MFGLNDVVKVIAPTGAAAYNVRGETFHHLFNMTVQQSDYIPNTIGSTTRKKLVAKFKDMLALIIDERSLVPSRLLGNAASLMAETIHRGGHHSDQSWGGLPILILAGDDYQLPGIGQGSFQALYGRGGSKMVQLGRSSLLECAQFVINLTGSKRVKKNETKTKDLLGRLRLGIPTDEDIDKLMALHLDNIKAKHGKTKVTEIEEKALFLFFTNEKRRNLNMKKLHANSSRENPVAVLRSQSYGQTRAKAFKSHFDGELPSTTFICNGAKVALSNRNFNPPWGLHNGACGTIAEIIFEENQNPNHGHLPKYVVVEFPLYCGPPWDVDNPKVRNYT